jgi:hypothetical protein
MFISPFIEIAVPVQIPSALGSLEQDIESRAELALSEIAEDAIRLYQQGIATEGSVDSGFFLNTVGVRRASWHERDIGSRAPYSGVVRRKGTTQIIGPQFAEQVVSELGPFIQDAFAVQLAR